MKHATLAHTACTAISWVLKFTAPRKLLCMQYDVSTGCERRRGEKGKEGERETINEGQGSERE